MLYLNDQKFSSIPIENILTPDIQELFEDPDFYIIDELTQKIEKAILNLPESYRIAFEITVSKIRPIRKLQKN